MREGLSEHTLKLLLKRTSFIRFYCFMVCDVTRNLGWEYKPIPLNFETNFFLMYWPFLTGYHLGLHTFGHVTNFTPLYLHPSKALVHCNFRASHTAGSHC